MIALDPANTALRTIPPPVFAALAPDQQNAIQAALAANARRQDPPPDPALTLALSDKAADGRLTLADVRTAWGRLPRREWEQVAAWQRAIAEQGDASDTAAQLRRMRHAVSAIVPQPSDTSDLAAITQRYRAQRAVLRDVAVYQRQNHGQAPDDSTLAAIARTVGAELFPDAGSAAGETSAGSTVDLPIGNTRRAGTRGRFRLGKPGEIQILRDPDGSARNGYWVRSGDGARFEFLDSAAAHEHQVADLASGLAHSLPIDNAGMRAAEQSIAASTPDLSGHDQGAGSPPSSPRVAPIPDSPGNGGGVPDASGGDAGLVGNSVERGTVRDRARRPLKRLSQDQRRHTIEQPIMGERLPVRIGRLLA